MKASIYKKSTAAGVLVVLIAAGMFAQSGPFTREIKKDFAVNQNTKLEISNKYGNVDIVNRTDQALSIQVQIKVNVKDKQKADDIFNMIEIKIDQVGDVVRAITEIEEDFGRVFRGFNMDNGGLEINYTVSMPKTLPLNLLNKYGNVFIDEIVSTSIIDIKYGKLTANKILHESNEPLTKIYLSYSNGTIQETKWIELDIKYSKININESKALAIISKYSKIGVNQGSSIVSESKYDTYELGKLNNFVTTAAYGHFSIRELSGKLQVDSKYTDVMVDRINESFENIKITNSYGTYKLGIDAGASYRLNAYAKYCNISYPENNARVNRFNENNEMKVNGTIGTTDNPKAEISVTSHYGNIRLVP